jgi:hypothetical protein
MPFIIRNSVYVTFLTPFCHSGYKFSSVSIHTSLTTPFKCSSSCQYMCHKIHPFSCHLIFGSWQWVFKNCANLSIFLNLLVFCIFFFSATSFLSCLLQLITMRCYLFSILIRHTLKYMRWLINSWYWITLIRDRSP